MVVRQSSSVSSQALTIAPMTPALATTMSSRPSSAVPWLTAASSAAKSRTSACTGTIRRPDVDRDDVRPLLGQPGRLGASLTASGAGDQGHLARYQAHGILLRYLVA